MTITAHTRIQLDSNDKFLHKTKKVLRLIILYSDVTHSEILRKNIKTKGGRPSNGTKTAHARIQSGSDGKFLHKTKKVLRLIMLYSYVTHSEILRKQSKLKLSKADCHKTGKKQTIFFNLIKYFFRVCYIGI